MIYQSQPPSLGGKWGMAANPIKSASMRFSSQLSFGLNDRNHPLRINSRILKTNLGFSKEVSNSKTAQRHLGNSLL